MANILQISTKSIFWDENIWILIKQSLSLFPNVKLQLVFGQAKSIGIEKAPAIAWGWIGLVV